jgi:hypothetical protein
MTNYSKNYEENKYYEVKFNKCKYYEKLWYNCIRQEKTYNCKILLDIYLKCMMSVPPYNHRRISSKIKN